LDYFPEDASARAVGAGRKISLATSEKVHGTDGVIGAALQRLADRLHNCRFSNTRRPTQPHDLLVSVAKPIRYHSLGVVSSIGVTLWHWVSFDSIEHRFKRNSVLQRRQTAY